MADEGPFSSLGVLDRLVYDSYDPLLSLATAAAVTSRVKLATIFGRSPSVVSLVASLLAGVALWIPELWLTNSISLALTNAIGVLPPGPRSRIFVRAQLGQPVASGGTTERQTGQRISKV